MLRLRRVFKSAPTTFHYFQTSYFTITLYYPFYPLPIPPSPPLCPTPRPAPPQFQIRAIGATTILHSSLFIFHHSFSLIAANPTITATLHYSSPRTTPILHFSFIKAPPSPLSPSFLSAPFSHFLTASYCCRAHCLPTAYSLSFSCRPLSSPRFS